MNSLLLKRGLQAFRCNLRPGMVLWAFGLLLVGAYYFLPATRPVFAWIAQCKQRGGFLFSAVSTALWGGLLPFAYMAATRQIPRRQYLSHGLFYTLFWAFKGIEVDALYRLQGWMFGNTPCIQTIVKKVIVDQFVYNPLWAAPSLVILYAWKDGGFHMRALRASFHRTTFTFTTPLVLFSTWAVWVPTVAIIYSLPPLLQVPLFNVILCFWALMLHVLARHSS